MRSCFVFRLGVLVLGGCAVLSVACGGGKTGSGSAVATAGEAGAHSAGGTISRASVEGCGGFTVDKAAGILGVEPSRLVDKAAWASWSDQERECPAVWFNLTMEKSVGDAASAMAQLREHAAVGGKAIDAVTGSKTPEYADSQFAGIGDEAFWVGSTDALAMRRGNVTAMVGVRGVDGTVEKTKVVARELAAALH